mgnify:CR=1 FL=1
MALKSSFASFNLPVGDVQKSKAFFTGLGFEVNPKYPDNEETAAVVLGDICRSCCSPKIC